MQTSRCAEAACLPVPACCVVHGLALQLRCRPRPACSSYASLCQCSKHDGLLASLQGDPFKTLFVGRISYDVTDKKLRREFEEFGPIKNIRLVEEQKSGVLTRL